MPRPKVVELPFPPPAVVACTCGPYVELTMYNHPFYGSFILGQCERCNAIFFSAEDAKFDPLYVAFHQGGLIKFE